MTATTTDGGGTVYECNAIIESVRIGLDRDFILSGWLMLSYGGSGQGFGGFVLGGLPDAKCGDHSGPNLAAEWIVSCMRAGDVDDYAKLIGKTIRVRKTSEWGDIIAIGHIVRSDRWFNPRERFESMLSARKVQP